MEKIWWLVVEVPLGKGGRPQRNNSLKRLLLYSEMFGLVQEPMPTSEAGKANILLSGPAENVASFYHLYQVVKLAPLNLTYH